LADRVIRPDQTTVAVLTGSGLKAADRIGELLGIGGAL
jgi:threonine synthase